MLKLERAIEIINYAKDLREHYHDPYKLAEDYGFEICESKSNYPGFTACIIHYEGRPSIITINDSFTDYSKRVLCAHELGHGLLHSGRVCNHFEGNNSADFFITEHEANLFAVAFLTDEATQSRFEIPLERMTNYMLQTLLNHNLHLKY